MHLPHKKQPCNNLRASAESPFCKANIAALKEVLVNIPDEQLAVHEPHAIHIFTSGSSSMSFLNSGVYDLSKFILELGVSEYPNFSITIYLIDNCE